MFKNSIDFNLENIKPPSANQMYEHYRRGTSKSKKYKAFQSDISAFMLTKSAEVRKFETCFSRYEHCLIARIIIEIPEDEFFTKEKTLPKKKNDIDNFIKTFLDSVFASFNKLDDSFITELVALKKPSKDGRFYARLRLEISDLF
jgi:Holliday junction resolvase RusA-like endonuclease